MAASVVNGVIRDAELRVVLLLSDIPKDLGLGVPDPDQPGGFISGQGGAGPYVDGA